MPTAALKQQRIPQWLKEYLFVLQCEMKLNHWKIAFEKYACPESSLAEIDIAPAQHYATISLSPHWRKWSKSELRATLTHELMHCHLNPLNEIALEYMPNDKSLEAKRIALDYVNERTTDSLSELLCEYLTLPGHVSHEYNRTVDNLVMINGKKAAKKVSKTKKTARKKSNKRKKSVAKR